LSDTKEKPQVPPWLTTIATAAALPLWLWVLSLSQERARAELRLSNLEASVKEHSKELKVLTKIETSLDFLVKEIERLDREH
jgi:hypothetical protein